MDAEREGLLDGLGGEERAARKRLLDQLSEEGFTLAELRAAVREDRLALLPVERVLGSRYTLPELAERAELSADFVARLQRIQGLPVPDSDERVFSDEDLEGLRATKRFLDVGFTEDAIAPVNRVLGEAMARLAATVTRSFATTFLEAGDNEEEVATRFATLAAELVPQLTPILVATFNAHLRESVRRGMLSRAQIESGEVTDEQELAVCFADIVGFTRLGAQIDVEELGTVAGKLAELAAEITKAPVRLVKTIGDAAMFVSREVPPLIEVALALVEAIEEADLPALRAGIALGPALQRSGDYYGHSVNLASRVTGIARPGSVLCSQDVHDAAEDAFDWSFAGKHRLKGVKEPVALFRARRRENESETEGTSKKRQADRPRKRASR